MQGPVEDAAQMPAVQFFAGLQSTIMRRRGRRHLGIPGQRLCRALDEFCRRDRTETFVPSEVNVSLNYMRGAIR